MQKILESFGISGKATAFGDGHINSTFRVGDQYVVQKLNTHVFPHPYEVMDNAFLVTEHIRKKLVDVEGGERRTILFLRTLDGKPLYKGEEGIFRAYVYINGAHSETTKKTPEILREAARAIGQFQNYLSDFDASVLFTVIPDFHNTPKRLDNLRKAVKKNAAGRREKVAEEIAFAESLAPMVALIEDALADGSVPLRVSHNDTKLNNVLLDDETGEGLCLIDLDTVMSGSYLYDFGDAIRFGATLAPEDLTDLSKVTFDLELFEAFTEGYLESARDVLTVREKELLFTSAVMMTYECGMRFLTDYLDGDVYFGIAHPEHNIDRARNQFALVRDMLAKKEQAEAIVKKYC